MRNLIKGEKLKSVAEKEKLPLKTVAGNDVETWMESIRSMSDEEFHKMMKQNMMK